LHERLEQLCDVALRQAAAAVFDFNCYAVLMASGSDRDRASLMGELDGVAEYVTDGRAQ
jgi:hypothetical protein